MKYRRYTREFKEAACKLGADPPAVRVRQPGDWAFRRPLPSGSG